MKSSKSSSKASLVFLEIPEQNLRPKKSLKLRVLCNASRPNTARGGFGNFFSSKLTRKSSPYLTENHNDFIETHKVKLRKSLGSSNRNSIFLRDPVSLTEPSIDQPVQQKLQPSRQLSLIKSVENPLVSSTRKSHNRLVTKKEEILTQDKESHLLFLPQSISEKTLKFNPSKRLIKKQKKSKKNQINFQVSPLMINTFSRFQFNK